MIPTTTTTLLRNLRDGKNEDAWRRFYDIYWPVLIGVFRHMGLDENDAQDAAQETLVTFARRHRDGAYDPARGRLHSWLFGIARRKASEHRRRALRRRIARGDSAFTDMPSDDELARIWDRECRDELLRQALSRLRECTKLDRRTILAFELFCLRAVRPEEVAQAVGMSVDAVYRAKHRCLRRFRQILEDQKQLYGG